MAFKPTAQSQLSTIEADIQTIDQQILELRKRKADLERKKKDAQALLAVHQERDQSQDWNGTTYPWTKAVDHVRNKMGISAFRHLQLSTINATLSGKDVILVMPTGGGKSLCYQIPAYVSTNGVTVVISPLVSLMEDQFLSLQKYGIEGAVLNAGCSQEQTKAVYAKMVDPKSNLKIVYVTPERIAKAKTFTVKMEAMYAAQRLARIVIDEVHCCSQWGHDFRPDYKTLNVLKRQYPKVPLLGLTATATVRVLGDVQDMLGIHGAIVFRSGFNRTNLFYEVHHKPATGFESMNALADLIRHRFDQQSGIVYCLSVKDTEEVARDLTQRGIKARCYHAQLTNEVRSKTHHDWLKNKVFVVVATVAFGMGIDKPDVRFVIHHTLSKSIDTYYQESGRAGRDSGTAYCIMFYRMMDIFRLSSITYQEKVGEDNLRSMVAYAHNTSLCRRECLSEHFGEKFQPSMCPDMCDICKKKNNRKVVSVDVSELAVEVLACIDIGKKKNQFGKCTPLQLMEAWVGGKDGKFPKLGDVRVATRADCERIVVAMMLDGYLTQTYAAAQYGYNSYLQPGPLSKALLKQQNQLIVDFEVKEKKKPGLAASTSTSVEKDEDEELISACEEYEETYESLAKEVLNLPVVELDDEDSGDTVKVECIDVADDDDVQPVQPVKKSIPKTADLIELDYGDFGGVVGSSVKTGGLDFNSPPGIKRAVSGGGAAAGQPKKRRGLF